MNSDVGFLSLPVDFLIISSIFVLSTFKLIHFSTNELSTTPSIPPNAILSSLSDILTCGGVGGASLPSIRFLMASCSSISL